MMGCRNAIEEEKDRQMIEMTVSAQSERCNSMGAFKSVEMKLLMLRELAFVEISELSPGSRTVVK
jgi:hypothetical protein